MVEVFPITNADFLSVVLNATYLPDGLTAEYVAEEGSKHKE